MTEIEKILTDNPNTFNLSIAFSFSDCENIFTFEYLSNNFIRFVYFKKEDIEDTELFFNRFKKEKIFNKPFYKNCNGIFYIDDSFVNNFEDTIATGNYNFYNDPKNKEKKEIIKKEYYYILNKIKCFKKDIIKQITGLDNIFDVDFLNEENKMLLKLNGYEI